MQDLHQGLILPSVYLKPISLPVGAQEVKPDNVAARGECSQACQDQGCTAVRSQCTKHPLCTMEDASS